MGPAKTAVPEMTTLEASTMPPDRSLSPATTSAGAESVAPRPLATASSTSSPATPTLLAPGMGG